MSHQAEAVSLAVRPMLAGRPVLARRSVLAGRFVLARLKCLTRALAAAQRAAGRLVAGRLMADRLAGCLAIALVIIPSLALSLAPSMALAQQSGSIPLRDLTRVQQGVGDVAPGSVSLASPPAYMRVPVDFSGVYRIPESSGSKYAGWYARIGGMGGLVAVFPRSVYEKLPDGSTVARLPPGTQFLIGGIPREAGIDAASVTSELMVTTRVDNRLDGRSPDARGPQGSGGPNGGPIGGPISRPIDGRIKPDGTPKNPPSGAPDAAPNRASTSTPSGVLGGTPASSAQPATRGRDTSERQPARQDGPKPAAVSFKVLTDRLMTDEAYRRARVGALASATMEGL